MLCKIVPVNGEEPVLIEINTDNTGAVSHLIYAYKLIHKNVHTVEGFVEYVKSIGYTVTKKYPILYDL